MTATTKLWQTGSCLHPLVEQFTVGEDYLHDQQLLPFDIEATRAHATMLKEIAVITPEELEQLTIALTDIQTRWEKGEFKIHPDQEDGHTAIEQFITTHYGEVGKKVHTGRSRNDQSLVMIRLFAKRKLQQLIEKTKGLAEVWFSTAVANSGIPMPGYTHMQRAMPTTVETWLASYACALRDVVPLLEATLKMIDQNPLGSAAGFGIEALKLKRDTTTALLGFSCTQENPVYCALSRGYFEQCVLSTLSNPMLLFSRFASDMMLFTMQETSFFSLPDEFVTGSSIMKKNYDLFEIMRANVRVYQASVFAVQGIIASLGAGYHRDLQLTKKQLLEGLNLYEQTVDLLVAVLPQLQVKEVVLRAAMTEELYLTEKVYERVAQGVPFREAYQQVKTEFFQKTAQNC